MNTSLVWLADLDIEPFAAGGNHAKHLAKLTQAKFPIIPGFVVTAQAYGDFLQTNKLDVKIRQLLSTTSLDLPDSLMQTEKHIKELFKKADMLDAFTTELKDFYRKLGNDEVTITLFETGAHEKKHLNKQADTLESLGNEIKDLWAEMFASHALWRRNQHAVEAMQTDAEIIIQKKIIADKQGTVITIDPHTHAKDRMIITMQNKHKKDHYVLSKKNLSIIDRAIQHNPGHHNLSHDEIIAIATMAKRAETLLYFPQEITWFIDGNNLYINDMKPINTVPQQKSEKKTRLPIARGKGITAMIATGTAKIIHTLTDLQNIKSHDVLVFSEITPKQIALLKKARAVIVQKGHQHTEVATLLRKNAIPAIFQVTPAIKQIKSGQVITVNGVKGEIYRGGFL